MPHQKKLLESKAKIRFHDCDPFNHLNNSRYIDYFMAARGDQLIENYGLDIYRLARESSIGWVSAQTQIAYLDPVQVMEEVIIQTRLLSYSNKSLLVEGIMWDINKSKVKSILWIKLVHFHLIKKQSHLHNESLLNLFEHIVFPLPVNTAFEERVHEQKQFSSPPLKSFSS